MNFALKMMNFVLKMINFVLKDWLANSFIWTWLVLPIAPLADLLKRDSSGAAIDHRTKTFAYYAISLGICTVWVVTMPGWRAFMTSALNISEDDVEQVISVTQTLLPFCKSLTRQ